MTDLDAAAFFALEDWKFQELFAPGRGVWTALGARLKDYLESFSDWRVLSPVPAGAHLLGDRIHISAGCRIEPGAVIIGPAILGEGVTVRTGAYVREHVILGAASLVGAHSEVKGSILLPQAKAPHQNYVGDSILGRRVNLGAGTICSNVKNIGDEVSFRYQGAVVRTGLQKLGAVLGDDCKTGCNTVLNPGVLMGPGSVTYPNATLRSGYYPRGTLVKVRQNQDQISLERLRGC